MNALSLPHYDFTAAPDNRFAAITLEEWRVLWRGVGQWRRAEQWLYGDLFNAGRRFVTVKPGQAMLEDDWAEEVLKLIPHVGIESKTLVNWGHVATAYPPARRWSGLSWAHHREIVHLPLGERAAWLKKADSNGWTVADLREHALAAERPEPDGPPAPWFVPRRWALDVRRWCKEAFTAPVPDPEFLASFKRDVECRVALGHGHELVVEVRKAA